MSDPVLSNMLRPAPSGPAQMSQRAAQENRATGNELTDDSFSRALERRMSAADRPAARSEQERRAETGGAQTRSAERPRTERAAESRQGAESRSAPTSKDEAKAPEDGTPAAQQTASEAQSATGDQSSSDTAVAADSVVATSETQANAEALSPVSGQSIDPALAANLAALVPGIAALPPTLAGTNAEDTLLDPAAQKSGASVLEKLIAETNGKITADTQQGKSTDGFDDHLAAFAGREWKTDGDTDTNTLNARLQVAAQPASPAAGAPSGFASTLQTLQPDVQAAGLQAAGLTAAPRSEQAQVPQLPVPTPAGQRAWAEDVGNRMMWMVGRHESKAELVLTPAHLGKLEVSIQINGDQTTAHFVAASSAARDALEQAMPRLREVLQQAGINLGQTNVSTSGDQRAQQDGGAGGSRRGRGPGADDIRADGLLASSAPSSWSHAGRGMVDTFA